MEYFNCPQIHYEGPASKNPFAFKHYDADALIGGKSMKEHLRFAAPYWHVMRNTLADPFGDGTAQMPWDDGSDSTDNALKRVDVFFEFLHKMGIEFYCWHDRDIAPELNDLSASNAALDAVVAKLKEKQAD
jgi:xylose isomerase